MVRLYTIEEGLRDNRENLVVILVILDHFKVVSRNRFNSFICLVFQYAAWSSLVAYVGIGKLQSKIIEGAHNKEGGCNKTSFRADFQRGWR